MEANEKRFGYKWGTVIAVLVAVLLGTAGIYQFNRAERLAVAVENQYAHSFHELTDYVRDVDVLLKKSMLATGARQMSTISSEIFMQTAAAKANLAQLPVSELDLSGTSKFLSQVGDYTAYLSAKVIDNSEISAEEYQTLSRLSDYAESVSEHLNKLENQLNEQNLSFTKAAGLTAYAAGESDFASGMEDLENSLQDYPSLIYDGPFSEHIETMEPAFLKNEAEISQNDALSCAKRFLNDDRADGLRYTGEGNGTIATYNYTSGKTGERQVSISVTKKGGYVLYMLDNRDVKAETLTMQQATAKAENFLKNNGFMQMTSSYYDVSGGTATINFAATQNRVVLYSDLIKVKVALDNGEIVGFEAKGYLMSHTNRELPEARLDAQAARGRISKHLSIDSVRPALIPLDSKREVLTYECKGTYKNHNFLIYINAETGQEEKILMLIESENGVLTV